MAHGKIEAADGGPGPTGEPDPYRQHHVALRAADVRDGSAGGELLLLWDGAWAGDAGTGEVRRFATAAEAVAAARAAGAAPGAAAAAPWPPALSGPHRPEGRAWWACGESEDGGMRHGGWPFMVCEGSGEQGSPYRTVASGIQDAGEAHLLRSAAELRAALEACVDVLRPADGTARAPRAATRRALDRAEAALAASRGRAP